MLQKKAIRLMSKAHFIAHTDPLFKDLKLLNLDNINTYQQNVSMYKYANKQLTSKFQALFTFNYNVHNYNTRTYIFQPIELDFFNIPFDTLVPKIGTHYPNLLDIPLLSVYSSVI